MDTFVKKLRGVSSNQNLPIYENVVLKNWIKKTAEQQIVDLSSKIGSLKLDNYEVSVDFMIPSDSLYLDSGRILLASTRAEQSRIFIDNNKVIVVFNDSQVFNQEVSLDILHTIILNVKTNKITLDGVESSVTYTHSTSVIKTYWLFDSSIKGCGVYIGEVKFRQSTDAEGIYRLILVPSIVNGTSCYKNTIKDSNYIYANTGELVAFNL
jgi:hypothetical protein